MATTTAPGPATDKLSERIERIEVSATMAVVREADKLRANGVDLVDFGAGEPHFSTPQHIKDAGIAAIQSNFTKYTPVGGTSELRDAIVHEHSGLLVDRREDFVLALDRVLRDTELRERLSRGAIEHASRFTWAATARGTLEVLAADAVRRRGRP